MNTHIPNVTSSVLPVQVAAAASQTQPDPLVPIQWAQDSELGRKFQACRNRNWINEELVRFSCKHWHCTPEEAVAKLLGEEGSKE